MIKPKPKVSNFGRTWIKLVPREPFAQIFKMSEPDWRFSQKGRTGQHWYIPVLGGSCLVLDFHEEPLVPVLNK